MKKLKNLRSFMGNVRSHSSEITQIFSGRKCDGVVIHGKR